MKQQKYYVYMMMNDRLTTIYVGFTNSLRHRAWEHKQGLCEGFTKRYNVNRLVYFEEYSDAKEAIVREKQLKGWSRKKKMDLIKRMNLELRDLFDDL